MRQFGGADWQNDYSNLPDYYQTFYRNYDSALGRFIGVDPEAESSSNISVYQYANNNPIINNDPLGNTVNPDEFNNNVFPFSYGNNSSFTYIGGSMYNQFLVNIQNDRYKSSIAPTTDMMTAARTGDASALETYASLYGTTIYNSSGQGSLDAAIALLNGTGMYSTTGNTWSIIFMNAKTDQTGTAIVGGTYVVDWGQNKTSANQGEDGSNGKLFDVSGQLDKSLNLTTDAIVGAQAVAGIGWKQMVREVPILKQLGTATGIVGFVDHGISFSKNPNWKDGIEMAGQLGIWGLKIAFPESSIIDAVEFGYNNSTLAFDTIWEQNH